MPETRRPAHGSVLSGAFRKPFKEQVAFFRGKLGRLVPTQRWDDLDRAEHDTAFMVAGAQKAELLSDLAAAVDRAVVEGKSLGAFRKDFEATVARNGWRGWTGEKTRGGRAWRTRTIYRTNASVSYAAGRRAQLEKGGFAFWVYRHGGSVEPREEHVSWDGLALPPDHPFWKTHYPPSEWGCSCYVVGARSAAGVRRLGGDPDKTLPDGWDVPDPATGMPPGVGRGWDYAPGESVSGIVRAAAAKIGSFDHQVAKAFVDTIPDEIRDALARSYRRLPSVADDLRRYAQRVLERRPAVMIEDARTIGLLTRAEQDSIAQLLGSPVEGYDLTISRSAIYHIEAKHGVGNERDKSQRGITVADFAILAQVLRSPDAIVKGGTTETGRPAIEYRKVIGGETYVAVFELLGAKRKSLTLKTFYVKGAKRAPPALRP